MRLVLIGDQYLQVLTEYDGETLAYTEFFRERLHDVFALIMSLAEDAPSVDDAEEFWAYVASKHVRSLGTDYNGGLDFEGKPDGYLYAATGEQTVSELLQGAGASLGC